MAPEAFPGAVWEPSPAPRAPIAPRARDPRQLRLITCRPFGSSSLCSQRGLVLLGAFQWPRGQVAPKQVKGGRRMSPFRVLVKVPLTVGGARQARWVVWVFRTISGPSAGEPGYVGPPALRHVRLTGVGEPYRAVVCGSSRLARGAAWPGREEVATCGRWMSTWWSSASTCRGRREVDGSFSQTRRSDRMRVTGAGVAGGRLLDPRWMI